ncbi:MAG: tetratricopeptide repeat protein [Planctomycetota bacterium]
MPEIRRRRKLVVITRFVGLLLVAGLTVGIFFALEIGGGRRLPRRDARELFDEAEAWRAHGAAATETLDALRVKYEKVIQAAPESSSAQKALLRLAEVERSVGDSARALAHLQRLVNGYPESSLAAQARYMTGRIWQKDVGDGERALASYQVVVNTYLPAFNGPGREVPEAVKRLTVSPMLRTVVLNALIGSATIEAEKGDFGAAVETIAKAREKFPDDPAAEELMMWEADLRADRCGDLPGARKLWSDLLLNRQGSPWSAVAERRLESVR